MSHEPPNPFDDPLHHEAPLGDVDLARLTERTWEDVIAGPASMPLGEPVAVLSSGAPTTDKDGGFLCAGCGQRVPAVWITVPPRLSIDQAIYECGECHERSVASRDAKVAAGEAEPPAPLVADAYTSKSGARSSEHKPAYHLVPIAALLDRVALRFELGAQRHGVDNWRNGIGDQEWLIERGNHALSHLLDVLHALKDGVPSSESRDGDALSAVAWFCFVLAESEDTTGTRAVIEEGDDEAASR